MTRRPRIGRFALPLLVALAPGCVVGPDFVRPQAPAAQSYTRGAEPGATVSADGKVQRFDAGVKVPENWWRLFNSEKLDPVVQGALAGNPTLQAALASLRQSQANVAAGEGVFFPQVNANVGASRQKNNPSSFGVNAPPSIFNLFTLTATVSYALDLFGGDRRALEGLRAQEDLARSAALAAYLTLTGNVVNTVIARAAYQAEIEATREVIRAEGEQIALIEANVRAGTSSYTTLLSLRSQLAATEATLPPLEQRLSQADHLLAALSGQTPAEWKPPSISWSDLALPEALPRSVPADLVRQRPDILQAEAQLHVASAQVGVATAALYPTLSLSGMIGFNNASPGELLSTSRSSIWNLGAQLTAPLFHGGTLRAQKQAAVEAFQASLASYRQAVLGGVQQVADALRALEHDAELARSEADALSFSEQALGLVRANFRAGTAGYLQLLVANTQYSQAKIGHLQAMAQRCQDTVALFLALGGGWWNAPGKNPFPPPQNPG